MNYFKYTIPFFLTLYVCLGYQTKTALAQGDVFNQDLYQKAASFFYHGNYDSCVIIVNYIIDAVDSGRLSPSQLDTINHIAGRSLTKLRRYEESHQLWMAYLTQYTVQAPDAIEDLLYIQCHLAMNAYYARNTERLEKELFSIKAQYELLKDPRPRTLAFILMLEGQLLGLQNEKTKALSVLDSALIYYRISNDSTAEEMTRCIMTIADYLGDVGKIKEAIIWQKYGQKKDEISYGKNSLQVGVSCNNIGMYLWRLGEAEEAIAEINKYVTSITTHKGANNVFLANAYVNLGNLSFTQDNKGLALGYLHAAERLWINEYGYEFSSLIFAYANLASKYIAIGNFKAGLTYLDRVDSIRIRKPNENIHIHNACKILRGQAHAGAGNHQEALIIYHELDGIYRESPVGNQQRIVENRLAMIPSYFVLKELSSVEYTLKQIELNLMEFDLPDSYFQSILYEYYANLELKKRNFTEAVQYSDISIAELGLQLSIEDISRAEITGEFLSRLHYRLAIQYEFYKSDTTLGANELKNICDIIYEVLRNTIRWQVNEEEDYIVRDDIRPLIEQLITCWYEVPEIRDDLSYHNDVLSLMELSKNSTQLGQLRLSDLIDKEMISKEVVNQELLFRQSMKKLNSNISTLEIEDSPDLSVLNSKKDSLFYINASYATYLNDLKINQPEYYDLIYELNSINISDIQSNLLDEGDILLEYFFGESAIFKLAVSSSNFHLDKIDVDSNTTNLITSYAEVLKSPSGGAEEYRELGYQLYTLLLDQSNLPATAFSHIYIVNDGLGNFIPFEALVTTKEGNDIEFLNDHVSISYFHSASLAIKKKKNESTVDAEFIGFATSYDFLATSSTNQKMDFLMRSSSGGILTLPDAVEEVETLSSLVGGQTFLNEKATESSFKNRVHRYNIIHLALHGESSDYIPMESGLLFHNTDSVNDGILTAAEIYGLDLHAELAVLSACKTGVGELKRGEGLQSIARAFAFAGVNSTVMSLWKVPDHSTKKIMVEFYKGLKSGLRKDEALRFAKLHYLENTTEPDERLPYYWAGFILQGSTDPIQFNSFDTKCLLYSLLILLGGFAFLFYLKRSRN